MNVRYQIFISSTHSDLKVEREHVVKAILEMGHIPVGMEMFSAGDDEQWKITRHIDDTDYYVVIMAHRYGSMAGDRSYTEKEYDYAVAQGIPVLAFLIDDTVARLPAQIAGEAEQVSKTRLCVRASPRPITRAGRSGENSWLHSTNSLR